MEDAGGGAILNISSMAGETRNVRMAAYASSKAQLVNTTVNVDDEHYRVAIAPA